MSENADKWRPDPANSTFVHLYQMQKNLRTKGAAIDEIMATVRKFGSVTDAKEVSKLAAKLVLRPIGGKAVDIVAMTSDEIKSEIAELQAKLELLSQE